MSFIRTEIRFKNATLFNAITEMGITIQEFSSDVGLNYSTVSCYINFKLYPGSITRKKICDYLGLPEYELFLKYKKQYELNCSNKVTFEISENQFLNISRQENTKLLSESFETDLDRVMKILNPKEELIIRKFYLQEKSLQEIGDDLGMTTGAISAAKKKAICKIRNNDGAELLREYL